MRTLLLLIISVCAGIWLQAQQQITFKTAYPFTSAASSFTSMRQTPDGGYITTANENMSGAICARIIKTDSLGNVQWSRKLGLATDMAAVSCIENVPGGGYVACGQLDSVGLGYKLAIIRLDQNGTVIWCKKVTDTAAVMQIDANVIRCTYDGGFVMAGAYIDSSYSMSVIKTDSAGNVQWSKQYCIGYNKDRAYDIRQMPDSGYAVCGKSTEFSLNPGEGFYIMRLDPNGNPIWGKGFGAINEFPTALAIAPDGGIAVCGFTTGMGSGNMDVLFLKTDAAGTLQWAHTYGTPEAEYAAALTLTPDGRYAIAGQYNNLQGYTGTLFLTTDLNGNLLDSKTYSGATGESLEEVIVTSDGGFMLGGANYNVIPGFQPELLLIKTDSAANMICGADSFPCTDLIVSPWETQGFSVSSGGYSYPVVIKIDSASVAEAIFDCANNGSFYSEPGILCDGTTLVHFTNQGDSSHTSYWYVNGVLTDSTFHFGYTFTTPGNYTIMLISMPGNDTASMPLTVHPTPVITFILPDTVCLYSQYLFLYNYVTPGNGTFSGGTVFPSDTAFYPLYAGIGSHTIYYQYISPAGCVAIDSQTVVVETCINGISGNPSAPQFSMYPNPAGETVHLLFPDAADRHIAVYDLPGQLLFAAETQGQRTELALPGLSTGVYFVTVTEAGSSSTQRLLLSR